MANRFGRWGRCAAACAVALGLLAGCAGGGGSGTTGGGGNGGGLEGTGTGVDDRNLGGGPDGTGSVPHVQIFHELPGGDPSRDVVTTGAADLGS